jgi:hypothetical protein
LRRSAGEDELARAVVTSPYSCTVFRAAVAAGSREGEEEGGGRIRTRRGGEGGLGSRGGRSLGEEMVEVAAKEGDRSRERRTRSKRGGGRGSIFDLWR